MKYNIFFLLLLVSFPIAAQFSGLSSFKRKIADIVAPEKDSILYQDLAGRIFEKETQQPLAGATIIAHSEDGKKYGAVSDPAGAFQFRRLSIGRYIINVSYLGYHSVTLGTVLNSARIQDVEIAMEVSAIHLTEINVSGSSFDVTPVGGNMINPFIYNKHPGTRGESQRKVTSLPGIIPIDDSRNDIIIRGNSPQSIIWRLEGINIHNPNHFNIPGTSGGPVSIINDKMLGQSQFFSGAFPAEYGNTTSGIFDLNFRSGDTTKHNRIIQFGFLGAEATLEGPIKGKSSYLFSIRRSTLGLFRRLNIDVGTPATPVYLDGAYKLNFPVRNGSFWLFGLGGTSSIDVLISEQETPRLNLYGEKDRDQYFRSQMGVAGAGYKVRLGSKAFFSSTIAALGEKVYAKHALVFPHETRLALKNVNSSLDSFPPILDYEFRERKISGSLYYATKQRRAGYISAGMFYDIYFFRHRDQVRTIERSAPDFGLWHQRLLSENDALLVQPYLQYKYAAQKVDLATGLHAQYFSLSQSYSIEPRLSVRYHMSARTVFNVGLGLHSQTHQPYLYFYGSYDDHGKMVFKNKNLDFTRSIHFVSGFERHIGKDSSGLRLKAEVYYQHLYDIPVDVVSSSFSLVNSGADFRRIHKSHLVNDGLGRNYGLEATLEKSLHNGFLFLATGSLYQSKYSGSDGIWRNTDFNGSYILNILATKEWTLRNQNVFSIGTKFTTAGGRWYGPVDQDSSRKERDVVFYDATRNTLQFPAYYRADIRITYKINMKRVNHEFSVDIINVFNFKNILKLTYIPGLTEEAGRVEREYQLGMLPFFYYRIDF